MELRDLNNQIREHAEVAYALLPETLVPRAIVARFFPMPECLRKHIEQQFQAEDWQRVIGSISAFVEKDNFSPELCHELSQALEVVESHDAVVARELMTRTSDADKKVIGECIRAISYGRFIKHDGQLEGITGMKREEWMRLADAWPNIADAKLAVLAGGEALRIITGYPHHREHDWSDYISVSYDRVHKIFKDWFRLQKQIASP